MAYSESQTLNYMDRLAVVEKKAVDFLTAWDEMQAEYDRVDVGTGITQDLIDGSKYAGITPAIVTTSVSASDSLKAGIDALPDIAAWRQQMELYCNRR